MTGVIHSDLTMSFLQRELEMKIINLKRMEALRITLHITFTYRIKQQSRYK